MASTYEWPRGAERADSEALERWLDVRGWEVDPTVFMAGALGPAVQVRRIGRACQEGESGLLILPGETVAFDGGRMRIVPRTAVTAQATA
ncbi:hypothetical protein AB0I68_22450 [Streptomyces sp. NPDC050448]|uniref:hypothetical protein n=1 Tax=Streptomyces sp. NPDC050448 TaxID=3155404 RepID=UPI00341E7556